MSRISDPEMLRAHYQKKPEGDAPLPWRRVDINISGVIAVGFGAGSELLAVLTHSGLGIVDAVTGVTVALEFGEVESAGEHPVSVIGIGPLKGELVALGGLWGGGLRTMTPDGWVVYRIAPNWPYESAVLCPPGKIAFREVDTATVIFKDEISEIRALGFSDSGQSLVVASEHLRLWTRA